MAKPETNSYVTRWRRTGWLGRQDSNLCIQNWDSPRTLSSGREFEHAHLDNCISEKPIVVTGAQRPYNGLSTDGPINLLDAVKLACAPETRGKGAVVAFNGVPHTLHDALELPVGHEPISRGGQAPCDAKHSSAD